MVNIFAAPVLDVTGWELLFTLSPALIFACIYWLTKRWRKQKIHLSDLAKALLIGMVISACIVIPAKLMFNTIQTSREQIKIVREENAKQEERRYQRLSESEQVAEGCSSIARSRSTVSEIIGLQVKTGEEKEVRILHIKDPEGYAESDLPFFLCPGTPITANGNRATEDDLKEGQKVRIGYKFVHGRHIAYKIEIL